jgi:hypothetical protein
MKSSRRGTKPLALLFRLLRVGEPAAVSGPVATPSRTLQGIHQEPRAHMMAAYQKSHARYAWLYRRLAEGPSEPDAPHANGPEK